MAMIDKYLFRTSVVRVGANARYTIMYGSKTIQFMITGAQATMLLNALGL